MLVLGEMGKSFVQHAKLRLELMLQMTALVIESLVANLLLFLINIVVFTY